MAAINFYGTTSLPGFFGVESNGLVQGQYQPAPSNRNNVSGAFVDITVTAPVYGGMLITEYAPAADALVSLGGKVDVATSTATGTGFVVANGMYNAVITAGALGATVAPYVTGGNSVQLARFGSGLEVAVAIDPAIVATVQGGVINQQVSWDATNQRLTTYAEASGALPCQILKIEKNSKVISIDATSGLPVWSDGTAALIRLN
ncbi:hypothetical protein [Paraburkholderia tropica]|uniref:hypothetical protein n=1 Tax=Paraburkholderia tropica TaxID=92647 RepID=UPI002AB18E40|nr:hypothetical protein [Paraburkholderia tropica]